MVDNLNTETSTVKEIRINSNDWATCLEQIILKHYMNHFKEKNYEPTHILMNPKDVYQLQKCMYERYNQNNVSMSIDSRLKYKGMTIIRTTDLVESEIIVL